MVDTHFTTLWLYLVPAAAVLLLLLAYACLLWLIPALCSRTNVRTDIHATRAAYAAAILGAGCLALWAITIMIIGLVSSLRQLKVI